MLENGVEKAPNVGKQAKFSDWKMKKGPKYWKMIILAQTLHPGAIFAFFCRTSALDNLLPMHF